MPSASMKASSKKASGCCLQARNRVSLMVSMSRSTSASAEATTEVTRRGGIGDACGPEGVQVDLVVATDFEVLDTAATGQDVVGDVQHVVTLEVGLVTLEEMKVVVDVLDQAEFPSHEVDRPESTGRNGLDAVGDFGVDIGGGHHRLMSFGSGLILDAAEDSPLACGELAAESGVHSKTSRRRIDEAVKYLDDSPKPGGFRVSSSEGSWDYAWLRARAGQRYSLEWH